ATKNFGARKAYSNILAFIDDDVFIEGKWAEEALKSIYIDKADVVTGIVESKDIKGNIFSELMTIRGRYISLMKNRIGSISNIGGIIAIKREVFEIVGGYNEYPFICGANRSTDVDLSWRILKYGNIKIVQNDQMRSWQIERLTLIEYVKQKFNSGYSLQFHLLFWNRNPYSVNQPQNRSIWTLLKNIIINLNIINNAIFMSKNFQTRGMIHSIKLGYALSIKRIAKDLGSLKCMLINTKLIKKSRLVNSTSINKDLKC
ncbi:Glycosyl transferase, family 2 domain protein, partial [Candidatus Magnetomorum sp. HK-1]